jgi:magnesium transporter
VIRSYFHAGTGALRRDLPIPELREALKAGKGVLWVDLEAPTPEEAKLLGPDLFGFHPLAVEDCLHAASRPKVDDYEDYLYLVFHAWSKEGEVVRLEEVDFFLGKHYLVTHHTEPRTSVVGVADLVERDPALAMGSGPDMILHAVLDRMVDRYTVVVDSLDERVDGLETSILENPSNAALREILAVKRELQGIFRAIRHQRDVVNSLAREGHPTISRKGRQYLRDVYDHVVRVHDTIEGLRDEVAGARDAYLSVVSNRMNEVMKALTIVSTLALPVILVTGVFGMNFDSIPLVHRPGGFWISASLMVAMGAGMYAWFRAKRWV